MTRHGHLYRIGFAGYVAGWSVAQVGDTLSATPDGGEPVSCDKCGADNWRRYTWGPEKRYGYYCIRCDWDATDENEAALERRTNGTPTNEPECEAHEWGRFLSNPGRCVCVICGTPYTPPRSFSDIDLHEAPTPRRHRGDLDVLRGDEGEHSEKWEGFGGNGPEEIERARREAA